MPVVVTGADLPLGRAVVDALVAAGVAEVRATVRDRAAAAALVARGVRTAVSDLVDPLRFGAVLEGAHTVIHLDGAVPSASWDLLLDAAEDTGVRRLVTVCGPGQEVPPSEAYDVVVIRAGTGSGAGDPTVDAAPALVEALVAADRRREVGGFEVVPVPD